jgi:hypothetical protein
MSRTLFHEELMRNLTKVLMTAALAAAFVSITLAQGRGQFGGRMMVSEATLLASKDIQSELKLTDAQKEKLTKLTEKIAADRKDTFGGGKGKFDKEAFAKVQEEANKATAEFVKMELKPDQAKRLKQLTLQASVQFNGPEVFTRDEVQSELKFTEKQREIAKTVAGDTQKDAKELRDAAGKDKDKQAAAREKVQKLNQEGSEKVTTTFTDDQKKTWKEMLGDKFEITQAMLFPGGGNRKKKDN